MSALPNQSYANLTQTYWVKSSGSTPTGDVVNELSVITAGSTIEERFLTTPSNAQIQINKFVNNTRSFRLGLFFAPDLVNSVPVDNRFDVDVGNASYALTITQSNVVIRQPIVMDTSSNTCNLIIDQTSTGSILINGASILTLSNAGGISAVPNFSVTSAGSKITNTGTQMTFSNSNATGFMGMSGSDLVVGIDDALHFVSNADFNGTIVYNSFGWNPDIQKYAFLESLPNSNYPDWRIRLSNTGSLQSVIPFAVTSNTVIANNTLVVENTSNFTNTLTSNGMLQRNLLINRFAQEYIDGTGQYIVSVGSNTAIPSIVVSNSGLVGFPIGIDVNSFSNASNSSNSIGGVGLSNQNIIYRGVDIRLWMPCGYAVSYANDVTNTEPIYTSPMFFDSSGGGIPVGGPATLAKWIGGFSKPIFGRGPPVDATTNYGNIQTLGLAPYTLAVIYIGYTSSPNLYFVVANNTDSWATFTTGDVYDDSYTLVASAQSLLNYGSFQHPRFPYTLGSTV